MRDELLHYYERELAFLRKDASEFAERYPEVAGRLMLEATKCEDPHVERIIESCAMLAARIQLRLHDDFSDVTDALLSVLYPHYLNPLPSTTIVQMGMEPDAAVAAEGMTVDRHTLCWSKPVRGVRCRFRTAYPVTLWPIQVESVEIVSPTSLGQAVPAGVRSALRIRLRATKGASFKDLRIDRLRFFLDATSGVVHQLYELFLRNPQGMLVQKSPGSPAAHLPADKIRPVGFTREEGLLHYPQESFLGYRLLQEYFFFPDKFMFVDLLGLDQLSIDTDGDRLDVNVLLSESVGELDLRVASENLKLGCAPAINLFEHKPDPIRLTQTSIEYPVISDARAITSYEVYSIQDVTSSRVGSSDVNRYEPIYALRHGSRSSGVTGYWYAARRPSLRKDDSGTDVFLSLVDEKLNALEAPTEILSTSALCSNRDLPSRLSFGDASGDFDLEGQSGVTRPRCLRSPTAPLRAPAGQGSRWRIISHLALNHLSITDGGRETMARSGRRESAGLHAMREILKLYDFADSPVTRQRIAGLVGVSSRRVMRRVAGSGSASFALGTEADLVFDADQYTGTGVFLFASVLEAFLGLYASVNSFTQMIARVQQREGVLKRWPPRAGETGLL